MSQRLALPPSSLDVLIYHLTCMCPEIQAAAEGDHEKAFGLMLQAKEILHRFPQEVAANCIHIAFLEGTQSLDVVLKHTG